MEIQFNTNTDKVIEIIVWLADKEPNIDIYHVAKILFYADKRHLNKYGRPVTGDTYIKMEYGPAPSLALDIIRRNAIVLGPQKTTKIKTALEIGSEEEYYPIKSKRKADISYLSVSDLKFLEESRKDFAKKSFSELVQFTYKEKCYIKSQFKNAIDYRFFVDDNNMNKIEIINDMETLSQNVQF